MHKLGTDEIDKISLSCFDDKRYMLDDGIYTLAHFHKDIKIVLQVVKRFNKIVIKKKRLKKIVIKKKGLKKIVIKKKILKKIVIKKIVKRLKKIMIKKKGLKKIVIKRIEKRLHVSNKMNSVVM